MSKVHKYNLIIEPDFNYDMIGICSHHSDYRLVWGINELLGIGLEKSGDYFIVNTKKSNLQFPFYYINDEDKFLELYLVKNRHEGKYLIHENQQIDYFLFMVNNQWYNPDTWLKQLRSHPSILAAFLFDPEEFDSTQNLVF